MITRLPASESFTNISGYPGIRADKGKPVDAIYLDFQKAYDKRSTQTCLIIVQASRECFNFLPGFLFTSCIFVFVINTAVLSCCMYT